MKSTRPPLFNQRQIRKPLRQPALQRPSLHALEVTHQNRRTMANWWRNGSQGEQFAIHDTPLCSAPPGHPARSNERLFGHTNRAWTTFRVSHRYISPAMIIIKSGLMQLSLRNADRGPCIPCYMSVASQPHSRSILDFRLFYGVTLGQATLRALDSMCKKVPGPVSASAQVRQRYRFRGTDYEVAALQKGCVLLRRTDSPAQKAAPLDTRIASDTRAQIKVTAFHEAGRRWIDRQPKDIQQLIFHQAKMHLCHHGCTPLRTLVDVIPLEIERLNQSRPSRDQLKAPAWTTLYRRSRELFVANSGVSAMDTFIRRTTMDRSGSAVNVVECDTQSMLMKAQPSFPVFLSVALHVPSIYVLGWGISERSTYRSMHLAIEALLNRATTYGLPAQSYIVDAPSDRWTNTKLGSHIGMKLLARPPHDPYVKPHVEWFFRNFVRTGASLLFEKVGASPAVMPLPLKTIRKLFERWLYHYHHGPSRLLLKSPAHALAFYTGAGNRADHPGDPEINSSGHTGEARSHRLPCSLGKRANSMHGYSGRGSVTPLVPSTQRGFRQTKPDKDTPKH